MVFQKLSLVFFENLYLQPQVLLSPFPRPAIYISYKRQTVRMLGYLYGTDESVYNISTEIYPGGPFESPHVYFLGLLQDFLLVVLHQLLLGFFFLNLFLGLLNIFLNILLRTARTQKELLRNLRRNFWRDIRKKKSQKEFLTFFYIYFYI